MTRAPTPCTNPRCVSWGCALHDERAPTPRPIDLGAGRKLKARTQVRVTQGRHRGRLGTIKCVDQRGLLDVDYFVEFESGGAAWLRWSEVKPIEAGT
jgi:hypothetical protein